MSDKECTLQVRVSSALKEAIEQASLQKGEAISVVVREAIRHHLEAQRSTALEAKIQALLDIGGRLFEELDDKTPKPNCSCYFLSPCPDCTDHASSRLALEEWKEANK